MKTYCFNHPLYGLVFEEQRGRFLTRRYFTHEVKALAIKELERK